MDLPPPLIPSLPVDSPARRRLPPLLRRAWYGLNQAFRRRLTDSGLTPDQFTVMRILLESKPIGVTQRALAEIMSSDPNTIASLLERMESFGWLERNPHESDRRAHRIRLLPAGKKIYAQVRPIAINLQTEILSALPESRQDGFLECLEIIAAACRASAEKSPRRNGNPL
jgi:DNA-binding MarR family transcriptional regulator